jgi:opacity protein-like surface antigen
MRSKLALSALVVASLLGATAIASAQTQQPAPGASSEGKVGPGATGTKMKSSKMKSGTTTGSAMKAKKGAAAPATDNSASPGNK